MPPKFWLILIFYAASVFAIRRTFLWQPRFLEPLGMGAMIAGIVFICQPWVMFLYRNGLTLLIFGLIYWNIAANVKSGDRSIKEE